MREIQGNKTRRRIRDILQVQIRIIILIKIRKLNQMRRMRVRMIVMMIKILKGGR